MIKSIHHLNFLVKDLALNAQYLSRVLQVTPFYEDLPQRQVKTARFELNGIFIVLVSPLGEIGEPARILAQRGEGLFLLSLTCLSIDETLDRLEKQNIHPSSARRQGLMDWQIIDLEAPTGLGPVLQLCQQHPVEN